MIASAPAGVVALRLSASRKGCAISSWIGFADPLKSRPVASVEAQRLGAGGRRLASQQGVPAGALTFECRVEARAKGGQDQQENGTLGVTGRRRGTAMLVAASTSYPRYNGVSADPAALEQGDAWPIGRQALDPNVLADHQADHRSLFRRVDINFGRTRAELLPTDERIKSSPTTRRSVLGGALLHQYGRYLLIACSRPGRQPANLQGLVERQGQAALGAERARSTSTPR